MKILLRPRLRTFFLLMALLSASLYAQPQLESLNRGLVAVRKSDAVVFLSWRYLGTDPDGVSFNLYRDGEKLNEYPLKGATNYEDATSANHSYEVRAVVDGVEQAGDGAVQVWASNYLDLPLSVPAGGQTPDGVNYTYSPNDLSVGDLDGDGTYEILVKWDPSNSKDNSQSGYTGNVYLDAYKLDGTFLWRIDLGKNIRAGAHYTQFLVYDFDGDGQAEVVCKTAPGTIDGDGVFLSEGPAAAANHSADYRNSSGYILTGEEYLSVFNGLTGAEMASVSYIPARGKVSDWGDSYGNRVDRFLAGVAYLDGERPSIVMARGYYTRAVLAAWDWQDGVLVPRWVFDSKDSGNGAYAGQGNHQLSVADVDADGFDEIIYGSCVIDHDGKGLHSTGLGHGDALHVGDLVPERPGLEIFMPHESGGNGVSLRDAHTGEIIWQKRNSQDIGRGLTADIIAEHPGNEFWASSGMGVYNSKGEIVGSGPTINHVIWWDGDLLREMLDGTTITKYPRATIFTAAGCASNNSSKSNPGLQADLLGDWREEVIFRTSDNTRLRIYTTDIPTVYRIPCLMHDAQYRTAIAWQNVAYNQPPHVSYFLGHGMVLEHEQSFLRYPYALQATEVGENNLLLQWQNLETQADQVVVEMGTSSDHFVEYGRVDATAAETLIADLEPGTVYYFRLKTVNADQESDYSSFFEVKTLETPVPPVVSELVYPADGVLGVDYGRLELQWSNSTNLVAGALTYKVFMSVDGGGLTEIAENLQVPAFVLPRLQEGVTYRWQIEAENALGTSLSEVASFTTAQLGDRELLLHIPFDEQSGSEAKDVISGTNSVAVDLQPDWAAGQLNGGVGFPAVPATGHFSFPHHESILLDQQSFSIAMWFKSDGSQPDSYLLHKGKHDHNNGGNGKWIGIQYKGSKLVFAVDDDVTKTNLDIEGDDQWFDNQWHHLVCVRDKAAGQLLVYVDGFLAGSIGDATTGDVGVTSSLILGNCDGYYNTPYSGSMDDLKIFGEALTLGEVRDLSAQVLTSSAQPVSMAGDVTVAPNPFDDHLIIECAACTGRDLLEVLFYDMSGRLVKRVQTTAADGRVEVEGLSALASGVYTVVLRGGAGGLGGIGGPGGPGGPGLPGLKPWVMIKR